MNIGIGSDHGGFRLKEGLKKYLASKGLKVYDVGPFNENSCDYPDFVVKLCTLLKKRKVQRGIFICKTGIGSSIALNKCRGVRAGLVINEDMAYFSRFHNNINVLVFGAKYVSLKRAKKLVDIFLHTGFEGARHRRRILKIKKMEREQC